MKFNYIYYKFLCIVIYTIIFFYFINLTYYCYSLNLSLLLLYIICIYLFVYYINKIFFFLESKKKIFLRRINLELKFFFKVSFKKHNFIKYTYFKINFIRRSQYKINCMSIVSYYNIIDINCSFRKMIKIYHIQKLKDIFIFFLLLIFLVFIRFFILNFYYIPSGSMIPTLLIGDYLITLPMFYGIKIPFYKKYFFQWNLPQKGDLVIFQKPSFYMPHSNEKWIKRIIGIEYERIQIKNGNIFVNNALYCRKFKKKIVLS